MSHHHDPVSPVRSRWIVLLALGVLLGAVALRVLDSQVPELTGSEPPTPSSATPKPEQWQCPMHPQVTLDHPGNCPLCGMKLVKMEPVSNAVPATVENLGLKGINVDPQRQQLVGLRTAPATMGPVGGDLHAWGRLGLDETRVSRVNVKVGGYVEQVFANFVGAPVTQQGPLFSFYSPELVTAQEEYLLALKTSHTLFGDDGENASPLAAAARRKLLLWDFGEAQLDELKHTKAVKKLVTVASPISGVVTRKDVVVGSRVEAGAMPFELVDLSMLWLWVDLYEVDLHRVTVGMRATVTLNAFPLQPVEARVTFLAPALDPVTRTMKARLTLANPKGAFRPEMFAQVDLHGETHLGLQVPADAVVETGHRHVVYVSLGNGKIEPREVVVGQASPTHVEVTHGLVAGDLVVVRATFLVDSESRLRASLAEPPAPSHAGHSARVLPPTGEAQP